ncbi:cutinase family protein [Candidatus Saccharibacteria bacterium]|nr:cutinase family protein [Candidatus Saccharibacteria bacterium]
MVVCRQNIGLKSLLACALVIFVSALFIGQPTYAKTVNNPCKDIDFIFARGSGQKIKDKEYSAFFKANDDLLHQQTNLTYQFYDLGTESYDGMQYPAVKIDNSFYTHAIGAYTSGGGAFAYGNSVREGVYELESYIFQRNLKCPYTEFVLAGYSQGAQVIGQALEKLSNYQSNIVYVALFGDPKLYLPEGYGFNPPACRGEWKSPWNVYAPNCYTSAGILGARKDYVPGGFVNKTGIWCNLHDAMCGSTNNVTELSGHGKYADNGGGIESAAKIILGRLKDEFPTSFLTFNPQTPQPVIETAYVIDSTGSMGSAIESYRNEARRLAQKVLNNGGRIALMEFRDAGDDFTSRILCNFGCTYDQFSALLDGIETPDGAGGDDPEAVLSALMNAFNNLDWTYGAVKSVITMTDNSCHDPDNVDGTTLIDVIKRSLEIDPINVFMLLSDSTFVNFYQPLVDGTSGKSFILWNYNIALTSEENEAAMDARLAAMTDYIVSRPVAILPITSYYAQLGQPIKFDASQSYGVDSPIDHYEWDLDGDGVFETTSTDPVMVYQYNDEFSGTVQVKAVAADGGFGTMAVSVTVTEPQPEQVPVKAPKDLKVEVLSPGNVADVKLSWDASESDADKFGISIDGLPLGYVPASQTSVIIRDLHLDDDVTLGVAGISADWNLGEQVSVVLPAVPATNKGASTVTGMSTTDSKPVDVAATLLSSAAEAAAQPATVIPVAAQPAASASPKSTDSSANSNDIWRLIGSGIVILAVAALIIVRRIRRRKP